MSKKQTTLPRQAAREPQPGKGTMWPLYLGLVALALIAAGALAVARKPATEPSSRQGPATAAGAQLAVDQEKIDFGEVKVNKVVEAAFVISNTGTEPLQILGQPKVRIAAGC